MKRRVLQYFDWPIPVFIRFIRISLISLFVLRNAQNCFESFADKITTRQNDGLTEKSFLKKIFRILLICYTSSGNFVAFELIFVLF